MATIDDLASIPQIALERSDYPDGLDPESFDVLDMDEWDRDLEPSVREIDPGHVVSAIEAVVHAPQ